MAGKLNLTIEQGTTFRRTLTWKDSVGNPVNLTGYTGKMQIREKPTDPVAIQLDSTNGGVAFNGSQGQVLLYISAVNTTLLTLKRYVYDLELTAPGGDIIRLVQGVVKMSEEVTV
jgi:hypothetical protein